MKKIITKNIIIFLLLLIVVNIKIYGSQLNFDNTQSSWAEEEIKEAYEYNLTYPGIMKDYQRYITREEFSTLAVKLYEKLGDKKIILGSNPFTDTNNPEVVKAYSAGIIKGKSKTLFAPKEYITRQEISLMIYRTLRESIPDLNKILTVDFPFSDKDQVASWALNAVKFIYQNGIIKGSGNRIMPLANTTREQAIVLLKRTYISFSDEDILPEEENIDDYCKEGVCVDTSSASKGLVRIGYLGNSSEKVKVMIEKGSERYVYPLIPDGKIVGFPLQLGNGEYKVSVLTNIADNRYSYIKTERLNLNLTNPNIVFLNSIQIISWNSNSNLVRKNQELIGNETDKEKKIDIAYDFIINNISYDHDKIDKLYPSYIPYPDETLRVKKGICYDYSSLLAAMKRSGNIPVKLVKGYSTHVEGYHAWNEILIDGEWIIVDTTVDAAYNKANKDFNFKKKTSNYTKVYEY